MVIAKIFGPRCRVTRFGRVVVAARDIYPAAAKSLADEVKVGGSRSFRSLLFF